MITSEKEQRWKEHFEEILNRPDPNSRTEISEADTNLEINTQKNHQKLETIATIKSLKNNKAPGNDNLPAEIFKPDLILAAYILYPLSCKIWKNSMIPTTWSEGNIVILPKKGDLTDCNSWRGITLLSMPSKIFSKIIVNRIETAVDSKLRKEQVGLRKGKSYSDQFVILGT